MNTLGFRLQDFASTQVLWTRGIAKMIPCGISVQPVPLSWRPMLGSFSRLGWSLDASYHSLGHGYRGQLPPLFSYILWWALHPMAVPMSKGIHAVLWGHQGHAARNVRANSHMMPSANSLTTGVPAKWEETKPLRERIGVSRNWVTRDLTARATFADFMEWRWMKYL